MEGEIGGYITDLMLGILRIVASEERPGTLTVLAVNVFDPWCAGLLTQNRNAGLQRLTAEGGGKTVEIGNDLAMALDQHRGDGVYLGAEVEQGKRSQRLATLRRVDLVAVDIGVHGNGRTQLQIGVLERKRALPVHLGAGIRVH